MDEEMVYYVLSIINGTAAIILNTVSLAFVFSNLFASAGVVWGVALLFIYGCYHFYKKAQK